MTNIFQPLRDMSLEGNGHLHDEPFVLDQRNGNDPKQQHIEKWLDGSEYETTRNVVRFVFALKNIFYFSQSSSEIRDEQ